MRESCRRGGPPWWTSDRRPAHHGARLDRRARAQFFRRLAVAAAATLLLTVTAMLATAWSVAGSFGLTGADAVLPGVAALALAVTFLMLVLGGMRRFMSSLGVVMEAADSVADGNYAVRLAESGPPPMRALARSFNTMTGRLQHADRLRRDLMADVAHELRTPLSVLQGRLEGLLDGVYPRDANQIGQLLDETRVLSRLIEDLRTLALSEAGALPLQKEPVGVLDQVQDVIRSMGGEAERRQVSLHIDSPIAPGALDLDPLRIREVLTNLVSNALQHTAPGGVITLSVREQHDTVSVAVRDTGEGMTAEEVERIFDRFYKGQTSRGSGLGLSIARGIISAHGGEMTASSVRGEGTTIAFTLPRAEVGS